MACCLVISIIKRVNVNYSIKSGRCILGTSQSLRLQTTDAAEPTGSFNKDEKKDQQQYEDKIRQKILEASLPFVPELGWSRNAISAGAGSIGYPGVIHGMFPQGGADLVNYFYASCNQTLAQQLKEAAELINSSKKTSFTEPRLFVCDTVQTRLRMNIPYLKQWPQAVALMTLPPNVPTALANLLTLVDDICYYAGDRSVDFNWYSRRVALAAIYKMTELYMIQDQSADHEATWQFLARRIEEAAQVHSVLTQSETGVQFAKEVAAATFTTARNILGLQR